MNITIGIRLKIDQSGLRAAEMYLRRFSTAFKTATIKNTEMVASKVFAKQLL